MALVLLISSSAVLNQGPSTSALSLTGSTVGPLFTAGMADDHTCTATVVDSPAGDVILTAAHCITGASVHGVVGGAFLGLTCTTDVTLAASNPTFTRGSFPGGTSGSPWIGTTPTGVATVVGIIGGFQHGGCTNKTSYAVDEPARHEPLQPT